MSDLKFAAMEKRITELTARVAAIEEGICGPVDPLMNLGFTFSEAQVTALLLKREVVSRDAFFAVLYGADDGDKPHDKIIDVYICRVRKKLSELSITVNSRPNFGWWIKRDGKTRLYTAIRKQARPGGRPIRLRSLEAIAS